MTECFPEPPIPDPTFKRRESWSSFLSRNTSPQTVDIRRRINRNLAALPAEIAGPLCKALHGRRFRPTCFELIVARTLQILGAQDLAYERAGARGRRPDFSGVVGGVDVAVDATTPNFDAKISEDHERYEPLIHVIEDLIPAGWSFFARSLPTIRPGESQVEFKRILRDEFAKLAGIGGASFFDIAADHPRGWIDLRLFRRRPGTERSYIGGPASAAWSDAERHIAAALHHKRKQLRGGGAAAFVAIAGGMGETIEDFDIHLFGRTFERHNEYRQIVEYGFDPSGIWGRLRGGESVLAGVLAYCRFELTGGQEPVLYVNPRFQGELPRPLVQLHVRRLTTIIEATAATTLIFSHLAQ